MKTGPLDPSRIAASLKRAEPKSAPVKAPTAQPQTQAPAQEDAFDAPGQTRVSKSGHEQVGKRTTDWSYERNGNTQTQVTGSHGRDGRYWQAQGEASFESNHDVAYDRESTYQVGQSTGQTGPRGGFVNKALDKAQQWGDKLAELGLRAEFSGEQWDTRDLSLVHGGEGNAAGVTAGTAGSSNFSIGTDGLKADFDRAASAGAYAHSDGEIEGEYGSAAYQASAMAEADASVSGNASVNLNGVDASLDAQAGVKVEASVSGQVESRPLTTVGGVDITVAAEGTATVSAEAEAHATAAVVITRDPPTAIIEGEVGASAVAKAEVEGSLSVGPIQLNGSAYASAGAEAVAGGGIHFEDGKLTISLNAGAAVGVGAGASGSVTVDVQAIGEMAYNVADANNDGQLGFDDAIIIGQNVVSGVSTAVETVKDTVGDVVGTVKDTVGDVVDTVKDTVGDVVNTVTDTVGNVVDGVKDTISGAANKVKGWFGW